MSRRTEEREGMTLTEGTPWKVILAFSIPVFLTLILQQLYNTVDTIIVGNFAGEQALAAVGTMGNLTFLLLAVASGLSTGAGIQVAQYYGGRDIEQVRRSATTSILLLLAMGLITTAAGLRISVPVIEGILAVPDSFSDMAVAYFDIYCLGMVFQFGYNIISAVLRSVGDSRASMYFLAIAAAGNICLDILFVRDFQMGPTGAAIATNISQAGACIAAFLYLYRKYPMFRFRKGDRNYERGYARKTLRLGFPIVLQLTVVSVGSLCIQRAVNGYGQAMTASFTVASRVETYEQIPLNALQTTMATYVGQNAGAGDMDRIRRGTIQVVTMSLIITGAIAALTILFTPQIIGLFGISQEAEAYCTQHIHVTAAALLLLSAYIPVFGVFQGTGDGFAVTRTALTALSIRVLATYTLCYLPGVGYRIVWWNMIFGFVGGATITWVHYFRGTWKEKLVITDPT